MKASVVPSLLIGDSLQTVSLRQLIVALARSSSTVLITGESGTGKELVSRELHNLGERSRGAFVPINCGAIPRELIESELFGHRRGAFTGALTDRKGRFELANGGTLFLDEIGDLPLDMQVKLLRVLQDRSVLPVGSSHEIPIDVRVVAATHRKLEDEVAQGRFREDLYYRINVLPITTSPLRDRSSDVESLFAYFLGKFAPEGMRPVRFTPAMIDMLKAYQWPGNVRELSNLADRLTTLFAGQEIDLGTVPDCMLPPGLQRLQSERLLAHSMQPAASLDDVIRQRRLSNSVASLGSQDKAWVYPEHGADSQTDFDTVQENQAAACAIGSDFRSDAALEVDPVEQAVLMAHGIAVVPPEGISLKQHLVEIEKSLIEQAFQMARGNVSQTARLLQLQRTTLIEKINKYDLRT